MSACLPDKEGSHQWTPVNSERLREREAKLLTRREQPMSGTARKPEALGEKAASRVMEAAAKNGRLDNLFIDQHLRKHQAPKMEA